MATVHWLGAGLSSVPGIRRVVDQGHQLVLWNRTLSKAQAALAGLESKAEARELDWEQLSAATKAGDVLVSMLPANMHIQVAEICLSNKANFVSSSYISPEMKSLHDRAAAAGVTLLNEVGLDPGLDHLLAHLLMNNYKTSEKFDKGNAHYFRSYCGGLSKEVNDFKYKFSWSPLGVLRALTNQSQWIEGGETRQGDRPWHNLKQYQAPLPAGKETFQTYPNRDSIPYVSEYGFEEDWNLQEFVRGTIRYDGWSDAWSDIFELVEQTVKDGNEERLQTKSDELWEKYKINDGEPDRVVMSVELEVQNESNDTVWHQLYSIDEIGNAKGTAMARLVSLTVSVGIDAVLGGDIKPGVAEAPHDIAIVNEWLAAMTAMGESFHHEVVV